MISIRAPRVGCDTGRIAARGRRIYFNPRTPQGARLKSGEERGLKPKFQSTHPAWGATFILLLLFFLFRFQSTHPAWGATCGIYLCLDTPRISIHAPRVGCDAFEMQPERALPHFNPRTPRGVRPKSTAMTRRGI